MNYIYSPQYYGNEQFYTDTIGATVILFPDPPIPYNNPIVRWRKNGEFITDYTLNDTTLILTLDTLDIGVYEYHFRHSGVLPPIVEFHSLPIKNYAEGLDLEGEPIIEGELIVEYGRNRDWADIDSIRIELMSEKYNGIILDSCSCTAVHIDLWKFGPDTINDVRGILGTDGTEERRTSSVSGIDSGQHRKNIFAPDYAVGEQLLVSPHTLLSDNDTSSVVIAVIDTGINTEHFAIQSNLWTNTSELEGNNIDDDNNGYIDDIYGFDFINRAEMSDGNGHGTKVGGVIAANVPAGMNISVMPIKTFSDEGWSTLLDLICGVYYAIENEANIINISGGYKGQQSSILQRALQYGKSKNMFIIAAAGNDSLDLDIENYWPATFARDVTLLDNVFAVTAVDTNYSKVDYANYGDTTVIVAAPGQGIYAPSNIGNENYEYISGTSVSTPLVSLALAIEKLQNPNRIDDTLRAHFLNSLLKPPELADWVNGRHLLDVNIKKLPILKVFLEGAMRPNLDSMTTNLKQRGLLPGQTPLSDIVSPTPAGHPYSSPPWNYEGTEWNTISDYVEDRVDWILVSLRTEIADSTEIYCTAAQLRNDGTVIFYEPVLNLDPMPDSVYVVIEHRNHMAVMSPQKVPLIDGRIVYDFTKQDSYKKDTSVGQIEIRDGVWAMYAGDSAQENDFPFYDINGDDKAIWSMDNGIFGKYSPADYNLDGETNGADKAIWVENNGISNRVPK